MIRMFPIALPARPAAARRLPAPVRAQEEEKVLNIYNWSDYIADDTIANFEKETGIKVRYDNFDSNEILHAKLVAGRTGYDIVVPSSYFGKMQLEGGLLRKLDKAQLPNWKNLDPSITKALEEMDPGNQYLVDWMWGYTTVGINVDKVKKALGGMPMPDNAWDLVFKPEYVSQAQVLRRQLPRLGHRDRPGRGPLPGEEGLLQGRGQLRRHRRAARQDPPLRHPLQLLRATSTTWPTAPICVALGWSGDINIARNRAIEGKTGQNIECLLPKTGGVVFMDTMAIPADAPHPGNAHKWINYILRPEVDASLTNKVFYANPNKAGMKFVKPEVASNRTVFPTEEDMKKMGLPGALSNDSRRAMTRIYTDLQDRP